MTVRLRVPAIADPDFLADVAYGEITELRLSGTAETAATQPLGELIASIHHELRERHVNEIVVDMHSLEFMAASCFTELVAWLTRLQELAPDDRYRIRFRSNPTILWQKRSLRALSCFDTDIVTIETS